MAPAAPIMGQAAPCFWPAVPCVAGAPSGTGLDWMKAIFTRGETSCRSPTSDAMLRGSCEASMTRRGTCWRLPFSRDWTWATTHACLPEDGGALARVAARPEPGAATLGSAQAWCLRLLYDKQAASVSES